MRRMKEVKPLTKQSVSSVEDDDNHYPDTSDTDEDSDDSSLQAAIKEISIDNPSAVHTIHVRRRNSKRVREPRLVAVKRLERLVAGLDTDGANIIFQPETVATTPVMEVKRAKVTPDKHESDDYAKKTRLKKKFNFLRMTRRYKSSFQVPNGYTVDEENGDTTVPLSIIHTESNGDSAFFFHHFATTRAWAQLRTMLKIISVPELRQAIKAVGQLKSLKAKHQNALHLVCMNDPPFDIVDQIIRIYPALPSQKDIHGHQCPLHTVLAHGVTSWSVVETIVSRNICAMETCDNTGMTPLMLACRDMIPDDEGIIFSLLAVCPYVINVENENEMNAIDFALLADCCSMEVMGYLTQTSDEEILLSASNDELRLSEGSQ
eukprot:scaffold272907_cov60-Attheya_sp.AAC.1